MSHSSEIYIDAPKEAQEIAVAAYWTCAQPRGLTMLCWRCPKDHGYLSTLEDVKKNGMLCAICKCFIAPNDPSASTQCSSRLHRINTE